MKKLLIIFLTSILIAVSAPETTAQCSMCRAVAESGSKDDVTKVARGLNNGILYLLAMPYILGGVAFFIWRKNRRKQPAV
jgi:hypothetical protein